MRLNQFPLRRRARTWCLVFVALGSLGLLASGCSSSSQSGTVTGHLVVTGGPGIFPRHDPSPATSRPRARRANRSVSRQLPTGSSPCSFRRGPTRLLGRLKLMKAGSPPARQGRGR